jgi:hypothetical protein
MYSMSAMARSQLIPGFQLSRLGSIGIERTPLFPWRGGDS